jgi:hypothetical protein
LAHAAGQSLLAADGSGNVFLPELGSHGGYHDTEMREALATTTVTVSSRRRLLRQVVVSGQRCYVS